MSVGPIQLAPMVVAPRTTLCSTGLISEGMYEDREEVLQRVTQDETLGKINHRSTDLLQQLQQCSFEDRGLCLVLYSRGDSVHSDVALPRSSGDTP